MFTTSHSPEFINFIPQMSLMFSLPLKFQDMDAANKMQLDNNLRKYYIINQLTLSPLLTRLI
jgi:hypothetical protein